MPNGKPLEVIAADGERTMKALLPWRWQGRRTSRPAGIFLAGEHKNWAVMRADLTASARVTYHELAHLLIHSTVGRAPVWLDEGLAGLWGTMTVDHDIVQFGRLDYVLWLREQSLLPVAELVSAGRDSASYRDRSQVQLFYAESLILTHYLLLADGGRHRAQLALYLRALREGASDDDALARGFGGAAILDERLRAYVRSERFPFIRLPASIGEGAVDVRVLSTAEAGVMLGDFLVFTGQYRAARGRITEALRADPDCGAAHARLGWLLHSEGRGHEAAGELLEARRLAPKDAEVNYLVGVLGKEPEVDNRTREGALRDAVRLAPDLAPARGALARLLLEEGRSPDEALDLARSAAQLDRGSPAHRATVLELETRMGCLDEAARDENALIAAVRTDSAALRALSDAYDHMGLPERAERLLRKIHAGAPGDVGSTVALASFLEHRGRLEEAEGVLREGLTAQPGSATLMNDLAYHLAERGIALPEALRLVDGALKIEPTANYADTRAWVLFRSGRLREAEEWIKRALKDSDDPVKREHLGDILDGQGRQAEAVAVWRRLLVDDRVDAERRRSLESKIKRSGVPGTDGPAAAVGAETTPPPSSPPPSR